MHSSWFNPENAQTRWVTTSLSKGNLSQKQIQLRNNFLTQKSLKICCSKINEQCSNSLNDHWCQPRSQRLFHLPTREGERAWERGCTDESKWIKPVIFRPTNVPNGTNTNKFSLHSIRSYLFNNTQSPVIGLHQAHRHPKISSMPQLSKGRRVFTWST